jgi:hypothetical protein
MFSHNRAPAARTRNAAIVGLFVGCGLLGARVVSACEMPPLAAVPESKDVVGGKQKEVMADVQRYHDAMTAYADCLKKELIAAGGNDAAPLTKTLLVNRYNAAVAEVQAVLKAYDENVKPVVREAAPNHKFENGGADSAFQQFPGGSPSSGQPRPPGN